MKLSIMIIKTQAKGTMFRILEQSREFDRVPRLGPNECNESTRLCSVYSPALYKRRGIDHLFLRGDIKSADLQLIIPEVSVSIDELATIIQSCVNEWLEKEKISYDLKMNTDQGVTMLLWTDKKS